MELGGKGGGEGEEWENGSREGRRGRRGVGERQSFMGVNHLYAVSSLQ